MAHEELLDLLHASGIGFKGVVGFDHVDQRRGGSAAITVAVEEESLRGWGCKWVLGSAGWEMGVGCKLGCHMGFEGVG
ncbi:unnamed protein product [Prunus armeniaca]